MDSITEILRKLKAGEEVDICDIYASVAMDGKQGAEQRLAALIAYATSSGFVNFLLTPTGYDHVTSIGDNQYIYLPAEARMVSMVATGSNFNYVLSDTTNFNSDASSGHFILQNERIDIRIPEPTAGAVPVITVFGDGTFYVSILS